MEENHNQDTDFMKETIKQRPLNKKKLVRRTLVTAAMAVIFGLIACLTFLLLEPVISNKLYPEEEPSKVVLVEETEEDEILPEDMIADDSQMNAEATEVPALEDEQIAQVLSEMKLGVDDYSSLYTALSGVAQEVQKSMVTVVGVTSDMDWFNNVYESEGAAAGVIIADNGKELLILTDYAAIQDAELLKIRFYDSMEYEASLKKRDYNTGLAVLSVTKADMDKSTLKEAAPAALGTSAGNKMAGSPVIAVGQPMGVSDSLCYGFITATESINDMADARYKWILTDIYGSTNATGILVNLKGQLVGVIDMAHNSDDTRNLIGALGITDLKKLIECMSNDKDIPYFGVHCADVTTEINQELEVPYGAYVAEIDMDSPAMAAGIQSGDVITGMGEMKISNYQELINCILESTPEQSIEVTVLRQGPEGYTEIVLDAVMAIR
jgi:S1-C subfamily serine protease